ncbi:MAG: hypothetical protein CSB44_05350 [Gammaproteobacteria bacterium]|nr:MAG: hypothetical protein CSB44_05350 [Gammaproteobacteria bacterium]PIE36620.1 MAG: hypothetical protein CSA54_03905 [Gammaproteobacteria bacterium]
MTIPFYRPTARSLRQSLLLLLVFMLLVLTGLGVFRLYFGFEWLGGEPGGELFQLHIRGGNAFNFFEAPSFGRTFWTTIVTGLVLAFLLPRLRPVGAALLVVLSVVAILCVHFSSREAVSAVSEIPQEFALLIVFLLFVIHVLLDWIGEMRDHKRMHGLLAQYVPGELVEQYRQQAGNMDFASEQREVSVLFCDVVGFSSIAETLEPGKLAEWLNEFFGFTSRIVVRHRGTIDKYMGDSIMAVWGAPARSKTHEYDALCAALDIQRELAGVNQRIEARGWPPIRCGIGVASGPAMVGPLGSSYRRDYTVVGDTVNIAERLEAQTRRYGVGVVVSDRLVEALPNMLFRELDTLTVKGRSQPLTLYEALGRADEVSAETTELLALHREAMKASREGNWRRASQLFGELRDQWGPAVMYDFYLQGIEQVVGNRPG